MVALPEIITQLRAKGFQFVTASELLREQRRIDLLWPLLVLAGIETVRVDPGNTAFTPLSFESYPWSHSLAMTVVWAVLAGIIALDRWWLLW